MFGLGLNIRGSRTPGGGGFPADIPTPALNLDLTNPDVASLLTTTRASLAWSDDSIGVWRQFANNIPRITDKGLLVEEARTNGIRNNSMQGAVVGTPGTPPTNWVPMASRLTSPSALAGRSLSKALSPPAQSARRQWRRHGRRTLSRQPASRGTISLSARCLPRFH
jgi:hypothetical protein